MAADLAEEFSRLLLSPASYSPWVSACTFSPGVTIRFHRGSRALDVLVCFHCRELAFQRVGATRAYRMLSFDPIQEELFRLVKRGRPEDARLENGRREWDEEAKRGRQQEAAAERWHQAMPASLRPFSEEMNEPFGPKHLGPMQAALARGLPEPEGRIRALLQWYGSSGGPWSGYAAYEDAAAKLLLAYATPELLSAIDEGALSPEQTEGAAGSSRAGTSGVIAQRTERSSNPRSGSGC